jgi:hypothetical protein
VLKQFYLNKPNALTTITQVVNFDKFPNSLAKDYNDIECKVTVKLSSLKLSALQLERIKFLSQDHLKKGEIVIKYKGCPTYEQNFIKCNQIFKELYIEALRAPNYNKCFLQSYFTRKRMLKVKTWDEQKRKLKEIEEHGKQREDQFEKDYKDGKITIQSLLLHQL